MKKGGSNRRKMGSVCLTRQIIYAIKSKFRRHFKAGRTMDSARFSAPRFSQCATLAFLVQGFVV